MGAPIGNQNALRYGWSRDSFEHAFPLSKLPDECQDIDNELYALRRRLLEALFIKNGYVTLAIESKVNLAIGYEQGRRFIGRAKSKAAKSTLAEKVAAQQYQDDAALRRDKAIASLGLDVAPTANSPADAWAAVDAIRRGTGPLAGLSDAEALTAQTNGVAQQ